MTYERPHSWCNFIDADGYKFDTIFTADFWEWSAMLWPYRAGVRVAFFKRSAPNMFMLFGAFEEGLEKTEEWFLKLGVDVQGIKRVYVDIPNPEWAKIESRPDHEEQAGMIIGGLWHPGWAYVEEHYKDVNAV
jgi:hypothetical protein